MVCLTLRMVSVSEEPAGPPEASKHIFGCSWAFQALGCVFQMNLTGLATSLIESKF